MNQLTFDGFLFYAFWGFVVLLLLVALEALLGVIESCWERWNRRK